METVKHTITYREETNQNEEKAREISLEYMETEPMDSCNCIKYGAEENASYDSALKMAEWKDEQEIEFLQSLMIRATSIKALNEIVINRIKLLAS